MNMMTPKKNDSQELQNDKQNTVSQGTAISDTETDSAVENSQNEETEKNININADGEQKININIHSQQKQEINLESELQSDLLTNELKSVYISDTMKEEYYRTSWKELCKEAKTEKNEDVRFMDIVIQNARDTHKQKNKQKRIYFFWEIFLIVLTVINTLLNSMKLQSWGDLWDMVLNLSCITLSTLIAGVTSYELLIAPKETWLRHMSFYSKITTEADQLFANKGEYNVSSAEQKIKLFKNKIVSYTQEDYQNFFANMSGSKNFSQTDKNSKQNDNV